MLNTINYLIPQASLHTAIVFSDEIGISILNAKRQSVFHVHFKAGKPTRILCPQRLEAYQDQLLAVVDQYRTR